MDCNLGLYKYFSSLTKYFDSHHNGISQIEEETQCTQAARQMTVEVFLANHSKLKIIDT